jgi:hypothetical protein
VNVTFLAPDSLGDSITEYTNGFLYYALAETFVAAFIALVQNQHLRAVLRAQNQHLRAELEGVKRKLGDLGEQQSKLQR